LAIINQIFSNPSVIPPAFFSVRDLSPTAVAILFFLLEEEDSSRLIRGVADAVFRRLLINDLEDDMGVYDERSAEPRAELDLALTFPLIVDIDDSDDLGVPRANNACAAGVSDSARLCIDEVLVDALTLLLPTPFLVGLLPLSLVAGLLLTLDCASRYAFVREESLASAILAVASMLSSAGRANDFI
jgi:hypothetical protein